MKARLLIAVLFAVPPAAAVAQQDISAPGTVAHRAAGTGFPERIGAFARSTVSRYDAEGLDISANYDLALSERQLRLSVYIYPAPRVAQAERGGVCSRHFNDVTAAIARQNGGATQLEAGAAPTVHDSEEGLGHHSVHRIRADIGGGVQDLRSESYLYCFIGDRWLVKYRASSPLGVVEREQIEAFIRAGPWPGRALPDGAEDAAKPDAAST